MTRSSDTFSKMLTAILFGLLLAAPVYPSIFRSAAAQSDEVDAAAINTRFIVLEKPNPSYDKLDVYITRSTDNGDSWEEPVNLSSNAGQSHNPAILTIGSNVYVSWTQQSSDGTKSDIYFRKSGNDGESWGPKIKLSSTGSSFNSLPLVGASGSNVYVVWGDSGTGDVYIRRSTNKGGTWASIVNLSSNPGKSDSPDLSFSGSNVYVVWTQANSDGSATDAFIRASNDGGATWESKIKLSSTGKAVGPTVASSGSRVHVAWQDASAGNGDILLRTSTNEGATWGSVRNMSTDAARSLAPELSQAGSSIYLEYTKRTSTQDYSIIFIRSTSNGGSWDSKMVIATNHFFGIRAELDAIGSNVHVLVEQTEKDDTQLYTRSSTNNGASFGPAVDFTSISPEYGLRGDLAVSSSGVFGVWVSVAEVGSEGVSFAKSLDDGQTWSEPVDVLDGNVGNILIA